VRGEGRIVVWEGGSLWLVAADAGLGDTDYHTHHAVQITIALDGAFELHAPGENLSAPIVGVAADASHIFAAKGLMAFLFIEPESRAGRALAARWFTDRQLAALPSELFASGVEALREVFRSAAEPARLIEIGKSLVHALEVGGPCCPDLPLPGPRLPDPRVQRVIRYAAGHLDAPVTLAEAAAGINLSQSRLRHLFVEETGLAFRTYLLWLRLMKAVEAYAAGESLTAAAHEAGFADSAHLSRTFRRTFGVPATSARLF
jgi:AraC-like DNA-binding protein